MRLIESQSYPNSGYCIELHRRDVSTLSSKNNMQTTTLKSSDVAQNAHVVQIWRSPKGNRSQRQRVVASAAVHKPPNKWTVAAAFILAVALHVGAVVWAEMQQAKPTLQAEAPVLTHSMDEVFETGTGTAGAARARTAVD